MKTNDQPVRDENKSERREDRPKKLGDKLSPARNDRGQHQSKEPPEESLPHRDREKKEDNARKDID